LIINNSNKGQILEGTSDSSFQSKESACLKDIYSDIGIQILILDIFFRRVANSYLTYY